MSRKETGCILPAMGIWRIRSLSFFENLLPFRTRKKKKKKKRKKKEKKRKRGKEEEKVRETQRSEQNREKGGGKKKTGNLVFRVHRARAREILQ